MNITGEVRQAGAVDFILAPSQGQLFAGHKRELPLAGRWKEIAKYKQEIG
jgi:hypothetical protein